MYQTAAISFSSPLFMVMLAVALYLMGYGLRLLILPREGVLHFGADMEEGKDLPYARTTGSRSIALAIIMIGMLALGDRPALVIVALSAALVSFLDVWVILRGTARPDVVIHLGQGIILLVLAGVMALNL